MHKIGLAFVLLLLFAERAQAGCRHGDDWRECHRMSLSELEAEDNKNRGYKLLSLDMCDGGSSGSRLYSAVWIRDGAPQIKQFDVTWDTVLKLLDTYKKDFSPIIVTSSDGKHFALVFEKGGPSSSVHWKKNEDEFAHANDEQRKLNRRLIWAKAFGQPAQYLGVWREQESSTTMAPSGWAWRADDTFEKFGEAMTAFKAGHMRPGLVIPHPNRHLSSMFNDFNLGSWVEDTAEGGTSLEATLDKWKKQGFMPIAIQAALVDNKLLFGVVGAEPGLLLHHTDRRWTGMPREWRTDPPKPPRIGTLDAIDGLMRDFMSKYGVRAASVAVVKTDKLQFARAYTFAEADYATTKRDTGFRLASCSKILTSILAFQADESASRLALETPVLKYLKWPDTRHATDGKKIQILHLLSHTSGLERNEGGSMGADHDIVDALKKAHDTKVPLPLDTETGIRFGLYDDVKAEPEFPPGAGETYSNLGYSLLGFVLGTWNGNSDTRKGFLNAMQAGILGPLELEHTTLIDVDDLSADHQLPNTARPHAEEPRLYRTVLDKSDSLVLEQYGRENWARGYGAHGFFASAPDLAKILGALLPTAPDKSRLLKPAARDRMLDAAAGYKHHSLGGFRLPKGSRHYFSKSGSEVGTHCQTMFPFRVEPAVKLTDGPQLGATPTAKKAGLPHPSKPKDWPKFGDLVAVVLIDSDVSLIDLADQLYDLFLDVDAAHAWPDVDQFGKEGVGTRPYK